MNNTNPFPQDSAKAIAFDRIVCMSADDAAEFLQFLANHGSEYGIEPIERSGTHS